MTAQFQSLFSTIMPLTSSRHPSYPFFSTLITLHHPLFTQAALMGGTTMVLALVLPEQHCSLMDAYEKCRALADAKACCDYALHVGVTWWGPKVRRKGLDFPLLCSFSEKCHYPQPFIGFLFNQYESCHCL